MSPAARDSVLVVGSGASAVHFALTALRRGFSVTMLDVGHPRPAPVAPGATISELKNVLDDSVAYFLGAAGEKTVYPAPTPKHYGFPPSKSYVFEWPARFDVRSRGFEPTISFARGGLAEAWTAGCYEFNDEDLAAFPISASELQPYYAEVARRIGVGATEDDLARFSPFTAPYLEPLAADPHSQRLLERYAQHRARLNERRGFYLGRSRVATLSHDHAGRQACSGLGRCLWGCPRDALYTPSITLRECLTHESFTYRAGYLVGHFSADPRGRVTAVEARDLASGASASFTADWIVLAAGTLGSSAIYLESLRRREGRIKTLGGLMDNTHVVMPFVTPSHVGQGVETASYQFHHLALAVAGAQGEQLAHGQITTLRSAAVHPIVQSLPLSLRDGLRVFRRVRSALAVANIWGAGQRNDRNAITLREQPDGDAAIVIECETASPDAVVQSPGVRAARGAITELGCIVPSGLTRALPLGSSVHYAGTLPMTESESADTCDARGRVRGFENLLVVDGASFAGLPAKNLTFTLMANASRIADALAEDA